MERRPLKTPFNKIVEARPHTAVYTMHKYFARRPWNVFSELVSHYSSPDEIVLDPFCGGGVTVIESLKLKRRTVGVDVNPLATYVTEMQSTPMDLDVFRQAFLKVSGRVQREIESLYSTTCGNCGAEAIADWIEWDEPTREIVRLKYNCPSCMVTLEKSPDQNDMRRTKEIEENFYATVKQRRLWFPRTRIPRGDKTNSFLNEGINSFQELFTRRNLLALSILLKEIEEIRHDEAKEFLKFAFSGSLKWASRQSHLRGNIVEGWAMHAYWIYPKSLEINVWNTFQRRIKAVIRGKEYSNKNIGFFYKRARNISQLMRRDASCLILNRSATHLPLPDESIDAIITDPPYGANVNYGELSDFWIVWLNKGRTVEKQSEVVVNRTQGKGLQDYEQLLCEVFTECHRVLKRDRYLVSTFNSRDVGVVASFITAASRAGFRLVPQGLLYQKPIRPYTTTFHAMQIGAFVGDFIFTFQKEHRSMRKSGPAPLSLTRLKGELATMIGKASKGRISEPELRESAYRILIPFLAAHAQMDMDSCKGAVDFFERGMSERELEFRKLRKTITQKRKDTFARLQQH